METDRAVEVIARPVETGTPHYGSGYCLGGGIILTCAHIIPSDTARYRLTVRADPGRREASASVAWRNARADIALLRVGEANGFAAAVIPLTDLSFLPGSGIVSFEMFGWPRSGDMPGALKPVRDPVHVDGEIRVAEFLRSSSGLLRLRPRDSYPPLSAGSYWSGMSGAAIFIEDSLVAIQVSQPNSALPYLAGRPVDSAVLSVRDESGSSGTEVLTDAGIPSGQAFTPAPQVVTPVPVRGIDWPILVDGLPSGTDYFQRRPEQDSLLKAFIEADTAVGAQVLTGMGGVGKTQLAADFARSQWDSRNVDLLVWVNAGSRLSIVSTYANAAERIGLASSAGMSDLDIAAKRFWSWLAEGKDKKWLIVLDDVADPDDLHDLKPLPSRRGKTIVTTRRLEPSYYSGGWTVLEVGLFTPDQARDYLQSRLRDHPDALAGADELAEALGYLPLALASASTYIRFIAEARGTLDGPRTCAEYGALLANRQEELAEFMPAVGAGGYERTVAAIWLISIERLERQFPSGIARRLMELLSLLNPNGVPFAIIDTPAIHAYLGSQSAAEVRRALRALRRFSLLTDTGNDQDHPIILHVLVQLAVRETTELSRLADAARVLADGMLAAWPGLSRDVDGLRLLQNNAAALSEAEPGPLRAPAVHPLLFRLGDSYGDIGLVGQAHAHFAALRDQAAASLGADSRDTLKARERAAYWLGFSGKVKDAVREFDALATDLTRVLGADALDTFIARHNVARFRGRDGDPEGAVDDLKRLVADEARVLGPTHLETLKSRNILGYWRNASGDRPGAMAELKEVLPVLIEHYGSDHYETLRARNDLAMAQADAGEYADAISQGERLVQDRTRVLGAENPATLSSRAYLAHWQSLNGENDPAALESIVSDHVRVLGARHPNTLRARTYYIEATAKGGDVAGAIAMMADHLEVTREVLGPTHIVTTRCQRGLAEWRGTASLGTCPRISRPRGVAQPVSRGSSVDSWRATILGVNQSQGNYIVMYQYEYAYHL